MCDSGGGDRGTGIHDFGNDEVPTTIPAAPWRALPAHEPALSLTLSRVQVAVRRVRAGPALAVVKPVTAGPEPWALYFVYAPDGIAQPQHLFSMDAFRATGFRLLLVIATGAVDLDVQFEQADAIIRKGLAGLIFRAMPLD